MAQPRFQLFPEGGQMDPDRIAEGVGVPVPDMFYQFLLGNEPSLIQQKIFQDAQFLGGKIEGNAPPPPPFGSGYPG